MRSLMMFALAVAWLAGPNRAVTAEGRTVPPPFRSALPPVPALQVPGTGAEWHQQRDGIRAKLHRLLGDFPTRTSPPKVTVLSREDRGIYLVERFQFDNGLGELVPGVLLLPKAARGPVPGILYCHWHGGEYDRGKVELFETNHTPVAPGPALVARGFAVLAIDAAGFGERQGQGPDGLKGGAGELSASKFDLWAGRTLWGRILRDDQMALDYLAARPEVDSQRLGSMGMSMGATRTWWLMALDERIKAGVAVACLTRYQDLVATGGLKHHGIYYYVPGMLRHFDTEAVIASVAPRALLCLNGDQDVGSPVSGIRRIEAEVAPVWRLLGAPEAFRSEVYPGLGHVYPPALWTETTSWLDRWLTPNR
jgi:dienelactone hydrolase